MITELTPAQEKLREEYYQEGLRRGRDCTPIDEVAAKPIFRDIYKRINQPEPEVVFFDSPISCRLAYAFLELYGERDSEKWRSLGPLVGDTVYDKVHEGFKHLKGKNWQEVWSKGWCDLGPSIWSRILSDCKAHLRSVGVGKLFEGQHWLHWHFFYRFCREIGVVFEQEQNEILDLWDRESHLHWWWPYEGIVIASRKPLELNLDPEGRLHSETRPAVAYADGFELYFWHGTAVPKEWITDKENVDASLALTWENVEQRRCLSEILGWATVLDQLNCKEIDADWRGILVEVTQEPLENQRFVFVRCPTDRLFAFPVPSEFNTAHAAIAFTYDREPNQFHPLEEA